MFKLHPKYKPNREQSKAIKELVKDFSEGKKHHVLLGIRINFYNR